MELFSLLAKLTLDASEFERALSSAQQEVNDFEEPDDMEVDLDLDTSDFKSGVTDSETLGRGFAENMKGVFSGIESALTTTGIVGAVVGIVKGIKEAVDLTAATADGIDKGAKRLSISRDAYQSWDHALRQSGASITDLQRGVIKLNDYLSGEENEEIASAFSELGISAENANGELKTSEQLIEETLLALADMPNDANRMNLVTALFGKGGTSLNALLDEGTEGVKDLLDEADQLGLVMTDEEIDNAVAYGDAVANLQAELDAIKTAFVQTIIPVLTEGVKWATDLIAAINPRSKDNSLASQFEDIDKNATSAVSQVNAATVATKDLVTKLIELGNYWELDEQGQTTWDTLAAKALELFPELSQYIDTNSHSIHGNTQEIYDNIDALAKLRTQQIMLSAAEEKRKVVDETYATAYSKAADASWKESEALGKRQELIKTLNEDLAGMSAERQAKFEREYGTTEVTEENFDTARAFWAGGYWNQTKQAITDYDNLVKEAETLRSDSEKLKAEAEQGEADYLKWFAGLKSEMGITEGEVEAATEAVEELGDALDGLPSNTTVSVSYDGPDDINANSHAIGSAYIPYDNYPALLHRGEKVLTATEARQSDSGSVDYSRMEESIIAAIKSGMDGVTVRSYLNGRDITDTVNTYNTNDVKAKRYTT